MFVIRERLYAHPVCIYIYIYIYNNTDFASVCLSLGIANGLSCHAKLFEFSFLAFHDLC